MTYPDNICRFHLYGHEEGWVCEEPPIYTANNTEECVDFAKHHPMKFMFVIDRYFPQIPIYLNGENNYLPYEDLSVLNEKDFPVIQALIEGGLCLAHTEKVQ